MIVYFICRAITTKVKYIFDAVIDHRWLSFDDAKERLDYDNAKELLGKANEFLTSNL